MDAGGPSLHSPSRSRICAERWPKMYHKTSLKSLIMNSGNSVLPCPDHFLQSLFMREDLTMIPCEGKGSILSLYGQCPACQWVLTMSSVLPLHSVVLVLSTNTECLCVQLPSRDGEKKINKTCWPFALHWLTNRLNC